MLPCHVVYLFAAQYGYGSEGDACYAARAQPRILRRYSSASARSATAPLRRVDAHIYPALRCHARCAVRCKYGACERCLRAERATRQRGAARALVMRSYDNTARSIYHDAARLFTDGALFYYHHLASAATRQRRVPLTRRLLLSAAQRAFAVTFYAAAPRRRC